MCQICSNLSSQITYTNQKLSQNRDLHIISCTYMMTIKRAFHPQFRHKKGGYLIFSALPILLSGKRILFF